MVTVDRRGFDDILLYAGGGVDVSSRSSVRFVRPILLSWYQGEGYEDAKKDYEGSEDSEVTVSENATGGEPTEIRSEVQVDG